MVAVGRKVSLVLDVRRPQDLTLRLSQDGQANGLDKARTKEKMSIMYIYR